MVYYLKQALDDINKNRFISVVTVVSVTLSVLIAGAFVLFFINGRDIVDRWKDGVRIIAYLDSDTLETELSGLGKNIMDIPGVKNAVYISREKAFELLKEQMKNQASLFDNIRENPLPASFEIYMASSGGEWKIIEEAASKVALLPPVDEVEYGQAWIGRFSGIINIARYAGIVTGSIFLVVSVLIVSNTIRLTLYSRQQEIEVMKLVGAENSFIKLPFYIEGIIQGALGGVSGILVLYLAFMVFCSRFQSDIAPVMADLKFLPSDMILYIILCSMLAGWVGCSISVKQFLRI